MADSEPEISKEELQKQIGEILDHASLDKISTKKVIQQLEEKLGVDLSKKKTMIDQMVMDYVNDMDSEAEGSMDDDEEVPAPPPKAVKKSKKQRNDDDDDEENDDSNDSDWGCCGDHGHLFSEGPSDENYQTLQQEPTITSSERNHQPNHPRKAIILKRVNPHYEDEADLFGKLTAKKLRRLPKEQRDSIMLQIDKLLYDNIYLRKSLPDVIPGPSDISLRPVEAKKTYRLDFEIPITIKQENLANAASSVTLAIIPKPMAKIIKPSDLPAIAKTEKPSDLPEMAITPKPSDLPAMAKRAKPSDSPPN